jgi:predicted nuclease of restriction endonuclease-like (RecB) superfamily
MKNTLKGGDVSGEFNKLLESVGFEFEFGHLYPTMMSHHLFNYYNAQNIDKHKKFGVILPKRYENIELKIGADGPYNIIQQVGKFFLEMGDKFALEMSVTFINKQKCDNIFECFKISIQLLNL